MRDFTERKELLETSYERTMGIYQECVKFIKEKNLDVEKYNRFIRTIYSLKLELVIASYSLGHPLEGIKEHLDELIKWVSKRTDFRREFESLEVMDKFVDIVSMVRLLNLDQSYLVSLATIYKEMPDSGVINLLLAGSEFSTDKFELCRSDGYYSALYSVLLEKDQEKASNYLKAYCSNWYKIRKGMSWYNTHKKKLGYFGYWSFEAAAIAKIKGLDLTGTQFGEYFPYSFFGIAEQTISKPKRAKSQKTNLLTRVEYPNFPQFTVSINDQWINESKERLNLITKDEQLECAATIYQGKMHGFDSFTESRHEAILDKMPWYRKIDSGQVVEYPIGLVNMQTMQGVWKGETEPTTYLVYAIQFGDYFMGMTFTFMASEKHKLMPLVEQFLQSCRYDDSK